MSINELNDRKYAIKKLISLINDPELLDEIVKNSYKRKDISASWIGPFIPESTNDSYSSFNNIGAKNLARWAKEHWMIYDSFIEQFCDKEGKILDVGCGSGNTTLMLSIVFPYNKIFGIDMDKTTIKFAKKFNYSENIEFLHSSLEDFSNQEFDYIFVCEVLEHMTYSKQTFFVEKCLSLLNNGGLLFLTTPNSIDEQIGGHHVGLLNENEFMSFYNKFQDNIVNFSFIDNKKLSISKNGLDAVINEHIDLFNKKDKNRSHFRMVMRKI